MTADTSRADPRQPERRCYGALAAQALLLAAALALLSGSRSVTFVPVALAAGVGLLLGLLVLARLRLVRRRLEEEAAVAEFRRSRGGAELFQDAADEALKAAVRAADLYQRYGLPLLTLLAGALLLGLGWLLWRRWGAASVPPPAIAFPLRHAVLAFSLFAAAMLAGSYVAGVSREAGCRFLRPVGNWLLFAGVLLVLAGVALLLAHWELGGAALDLRLARVGLAALLVLGAELVINVVVDFYRPRQPSEEDRPVCESRLLALVTEPGGIARNVAAALDYQFGFRVSEVWFYRFLERTVIPFGVMALVLFWLMTCLVVVKAEENGLRVRLGRVLARQPLGPGLYLKLPWPFERMHTFAVDHVQQLHIGYVPGSEKSGPEAMPDPSMEGLMGDMTGRVMTWSKYHHKEETNFVVASEPIGSEPVAGEPGRVLSASVNFLSASIPLYFKVTDLYAYAFAHRDARRTLEYITTREVVLYLANVDMVDILAAGRQRGGEELRSRIQAAADALGLGIEIVFVGLQGLHPPVKVGKAFDEVVGAMEEQHELVLRAEKEAIAAEADADKRAIALLSEARSYRDSRIRVAAAEAARFEKQLVAFQAAPQLYGLYTFLDMLETEGRSARKYIVALGQSREVIVVNLEKKLRQDLLDLDLGQEAQ